jgi:deferrochelatase/peroxidase EfeB
VSRPLTRRQLLAATGLASAGVAAGTGLARGTPDAAAATPPGGDGERPAPSVVPFDGPHQAGIATPPPERMVFAAFDVTAGDASGLRDLLATWTDAARRMTAGRPLTGPDRPVDPPPDTGEALGLPASRLTLTVGFGPSLFDGRFGLTPRRPAALIDLPAFAGDDLDPARSGGDLCVQACADDPQVAFHAIHNLTRLALGAATARYLQVGLTRTAAGAGQATPRNLLGFHDGTANLDAADPGALDRYVWVGRGTDQDWMAGGSYLVVRRIRIHLEAWGATTLETQEQTIGRLKVSGAPLGGTRPSDPIDLAAVGSDGQPVIPNTAHIRLASPERNAGQAILRRGYTFADGIDPDSGELDAGIVFICFQQEPSRQFVPIQTRLAGSDALGAYLLHTGSGLFACPPGTSDRQAWGHSLF